MSLYKFNSLPNTIIDSEIQYNVGDEITYNDHKFVIVQKSFQMSTDTVVEITYNLKAVNPFYRIGEPMPPMSLTITQYWDGKEKEISENTRKKFMELLE